MPTRAALCLIGVMLLQGPAATLAQQASGGARSYGNAGPNSVGGVELLLQADGADLARSRAEMMADEIQREMQAQSVDVAEVSARGGRLSFRLRNPARAGQALRAARAARLGTEPAGGWDARIVAGNRIVMRETPAGIERAMDEAMDVTREIIAARIDALGARNAHVVRQGANRILVRVAAVRNPAAIRALIVPAARLAFRLVDTNVTPAQLAAGRAPAGSQVLPFADGEDGARIAVRRETLITGDMVASAVQGLDDPSGRPSLNIVLNSEGRRRFAQATRENIGRSFAIVLDDVVISAPVIVEPILGGTAQISGNFTVESAEQLAIRLGSGALPIRLVVIEERALSR